MSLGSNERYVEESVASMQRRIAWSKLLLPVLFSPMIHVVASVSATSSNSKERKFCMTMRLIFKRFFLLPNGNQYALWCGRPDLNRHRPFGPTDFRTTSTFAAARWVGRSWSGLSLHHCVAALGAARLVSTPSRSELPGLGSGLPSDRVPRVWAVLRLRDFPRSALND